MQIGPPHALFWNDVDFASMVSLADTTSVGSYQVRRNSDGTVSIFVNYNQDINTQNITVKLDPALSNKIALAKVIPMSRNF